MCLPPWGAVLALSFLAAMAQTEKIQIEPLQYSSQPQARALFLSYSSDGDSLTIEELHSLLTNEFSQVQELNDELLKELMVGYDTDGNYKLNMVEFEGLFKFITKDRH